MSATSMNAMEITIGRTTSSLALALAGTSSRSVPRAGLPTTSPSPTLRLPQRSSRPRPACPHLLGPAHSHAEECPPGRSCRRAGRSGTQAPPSPCGTAFSEGSGSLSVLKGSSPITFTSPSSKAHQKSGSFPPPALPSFNGRVTLSDSRQSRRLTATLRPLLSLAMGLPRLLGSPFRRAVPTTPADRAGAHVDCFPAHAAFPKWQEGRHPHCHFRGLLRLHTRYGPPDRSAALGDLCHEAPTRAVTRTSRSSATGSIDNSPGGIFLHW
jgi:hypothetical protein